VIRLLKIERTPCLSLIKDRIHAMEMDDPYLTALIRAIDAPDEALALSIIESDPSVVSKCTFGYRGPDEYAIHHAAQLQSSTILKELLRRGADPNVLDDEGRTPLHNAISEGSLECVHTILAAGGRDKDWSAILYAIVWTEPQSAKIAQALFDVGIDLDTPMPPYMDEFGPTILFQAIYYLSARGVETLLACGANPSLKDEEGRNALQYMEFLESSTSTPMFGAEEDATRIALIKAMLTNKLSSLIE